MEKKTAEQVCKEILTKHLLTVDMAYSPAAIDEVLTEDTIEGKTLKACLDAVMEAYASQLPVEGERWVSVKTEFPPPKKNVLCRTSSGYHFEGRICYGMHEPFFTFPMGKKDASDTIPDFTRDVTHWMPLPQAPDNVKDR